LFERGFGFPYVPLGAKRNSYVYNIRGGGLAGIDRLDMAGAATGVWKADILYMNRSASVTFGGGSGGAYDPATNGGEFLYLLMEVGDAHDIAAIAEKIVNAIEAPCQFSVGELVIKPSIGIAIFPQDGVAGLELLKSADRAMYEAKRKRLGYAFAR